MAAHELGQGVYDDVGAVFDRPHKDRRRHGIVDNQRQPTRVRNLRERPDVTDVACGISDQFTKNRPRGSVDQRRDVRGAVGRGEARMDPVAPQRMGEQRVRRAVELRRRDDAAAAIGERQKGIGQCGLAGRNGERGDTAFKQSESLLQNIGRRIGDPTVAKARDFQVE